MIKNEISALKLKIQSQYTKRVNKCFEEFEDAFLALVDAYGYGFAVSKALEIIENHVEDFLSDCS